jgi:hypothetical protein
VACLKQKLEVGGSFAVLAGSGVIAIAGAPTVVLAAAGATVAVGSLFGAILSLIHLKECYERHGEVAKASVLAAKVEALQLQLGELQTRFRLA